MKILILINIILVLVFSKNVLDNQLDVTSNFKNYISTQQFNFLTALLQHLNGGKSFNFTVENGYIPIDWYYPNSNATGIFY